MALWELSLQGISVGVTPPFQAKKVFASYRAMYLNTTGIKRCQKLGLDTKTDLNAHPNPE